MKQFIIKEDNNGLFDIYSKVDAQREELEEMNIADKEEAKRIADQYAAKEKGQTWVT